MLRFNLLQAGAEPTCLMDFWAQKCLQEIDEAAAEDRQPDKHTSDIGMADTVMDFLFASQDASTASLVWMVSLMADFPEVLEKVGVPLYLSLTLLWHEKSEARQRHSAVSVLALFTMPVTSSKSVHRRAGTIMARNITQMTNYFPHAWNAGLSADIITATFPFLLCLYSKTDPA